jgi:hypothetical protein
MLEKTDMQSKNEGTVKATQNTPYARDISISLGSDVLVVPQDKFDRGLPSSICFGKMKRNSQLCESPHGTISASSKLAKSLSLRGVGLLHLLAASFRASLSFFESFVHLYYPNVAHS